MQFVRKFDQRCAFGNVSVDGMHHPVLEVSSLGQFRRTSASRIVPKLPRVIKADPHEGWRGWGPLSGEYPTTLYLGSLWVLTGEFM